MAIGLLGSALFSAPIPAAGASAAAPDPDVQGPPPDKSLLVNPSHQMDLGAVPPLYLPIILKGASPTFAGVLVVLINNFLLFVPPPTF